MIICRLQRWSVDIRVGQTSGAVCAALRLGFVGVTKVFVTTVTKPLPILMNFGVLRALVRTRRTAEFRSIASHEALVSLSQAFSSQPGGPIGRA